MRSAGPTAGFRIQEEFLRRRKTQLFFRCVELTALRKLMAAAKLRPRDATTYTSLARAVGRAVATKGAAASPSLKDFAIRSWKLAVQLAPARPSALRELAAALRAQGKEQAAERILARVAA